MANVVELKTDEQPQGRHALIISSPRPPLAGAPITDRDSSRTYYATDSEHDIALVAKRALVWADTRRVPHVYLRRETH